MTAGLLLAVLVVSAGVRPPSTEAGPELMARLVERASGKASKEVYPIAQRLLVKQGPAALPALHAALTREISHNPAAALNICRLLGEIGDPSSVPRLTASLAHPDPRVFETAIVALGRIGDERAVAPLIEAYPVASPVGQTKILGALASIGGERAERFLLTLASAPEANTARVGLEYAALLGSREAVPIARQQMKEFGGIARFQAALTLSKLGEEDGIDALLDLMAEVPRARASVLAALREVGQQKHVARIRPLADDPDSKVRAQLALTLGRLGGDEARRLLKKLSLDPDGLVHREAIKALYAMGVSEPVDELLARIQADPLSTDVGRVEELRFLVREIGEKRLLPILLKALPAAEGGQRTLVLESIALLRDPAAAPCLAQVIRMDHRVRGAGMGTFASYAAILIANIGEPALDEIFGILADPDAPEVARILAVESLRLIGGDRAYERVAALARDEGESDEVRRRALQALPYFAEISTAKLLRELLATDSMTDSLAFEARRVLEEYF